MGGSLGPGAEQRRRRRGSLAISLGLQGLLVLLMMAALAVGPRAVRVPAVEAGMERLTYLVLAPPRVAAPWRRVALPPPPHAPRPVAEPLASGRRAAVPPPRPVERREVDGPVAAPAQLTAQALPDALATPLPALPTPRVEAPQPRLGRFGAPRGLAPLQGAPVEVPQLGQFGTAATADPPAAVRPGGGGPVVGTGFSSGVAAGPVRRGGTVRASGFGSGVAAEPAGTLPGGPGAPAGGVRLDRFAAAAPVVSSEIPAPAAAAAADFEPPQVLSWPAPAYTAAAAARRIEGEVVLEVRLLADGRVEVRRVTHGLGYGLDQSATAAARQLQFRPARRHGQPVDWTVYLHIQFRLAY
ncbi:MAG TPA: TonB family protein [Terriglobales bacterium]|nr:TonB family protein [Terriglobales bacterium]